ncbi:MAG TPA: enolase C-terminal domain-like protein [Conexibacter sp.]|nr:enolase C-terminal domain-like protein [Conexibacter sp.]
MPDGLITSVEVATIRSPLPVTINFGPWVMRHREFALCRIEADDGRVGTAFVYTRDGPLAEFVRLNIAKQYVGQPYHDPEALHWRAAWSNNAVLASGLGLRALSLVDLAAWDLAARAEGKSIVAYLGGEPRPLPATAIIGYPPQLTPDEVAEQVSTLYAAGWRRFKQPIAATLDETRARLRAAREAMGPDCWLGMDCNWVFKSAQEAIDFARTIHDVDLGWMEDIVPPGNARMVAEIRKGAGLPVAMGDEQGGSYHPESLLAHEAVDVARVDVSTNGGITRLRGILEQIETAGAQFAPHMFAHVHSRVFAALGHDVPIEWGVPGSGVDQFADSLPQPVIRDGLMEPLADEPGLGPQANPAWIAEQIVDDPDGVVERLA